MRSRVAVLTACAFLFSAPLWGYSLIGPRWIVPVVTMQLQLGANAPTLLDGSASWGAAAEDALNGWSGTIANLQFAVVRDSTAPRAQGNGINNVFFTGDVYGDAWGSGVLAVTLSYSSLSRMTEADVLFNSQLAWNSYRGGQRGATYDFHRVALHEFGHVLGLDHPDQAGQQVTALMNSRISGLDALAADDISGARSLYGTPAAVTPLAPPPIIISQPASQSVLVGQNVSFTVGVSSTSTVTYRWLKGGTTLTGATAATLTLNAVSLADAGSYTVVATCASGSITSAAATLNVTAPPVLATVTPTAPVTPVAPFVPSAPAVPLVPIAPVVVAPSITANPAPQVVTQGNSATYSVVATGSAPFSYQWLKNGFAIAGATSATLKIDVAQVSDTATYTVRVTNSAGSATSGPVTLTVNSPPVIVAQPVAATVAGGDTVTFSVAAGGNPSPGFQWRKDGVDIPGAIRSTLTLEGVQPADAGRYTAGVLNSVGTVTSAGATLTVNYSRIVNLSTRGYVAAGGTLTPGFVIRGAGTKPVVIRAIGPGLTGFGVSQALPDLQLAVIAAGGQTPLLSNQRWGGATELREAFARVGAFPLVPDSEDAAAQAMLAASGYTVRIAPASAGAAGIALAELYDAGALGASARLVNASTLGFVGAGEQALTPGFVIRGTAAKRLLIRAVGPGLAPFGIADLLFDPLLEVIPAGQTVASASNDDWGDTTGLKAAFTQAGAFMLPDRSKDAAIVVTLAPGAYTVVISGVAGATGTALVELYDLDP